MQLPRWSFPFVCATAVVALYLAAALHPVTDDVSQLDRIVHKIEKAPTLSAEARAAIDRLVAQTRAHGRLSEQATARRDAAIARVLGAVKAKEQLATAGAL